MEILQKIFPFSFKEKKGVAALIVNIIIYVVAGVIAGALIAILNKIPVVNIIVSLVGTLVNVYTTAGIVLSILHYLKVLK